MAKYTVRGAEEVIRRLADLGKTAVKAAIRRGARAGAKIIAARARELVPVRTGALRKEIKVRALKRSRRYTGAVVTTRVAEGPVYYGSFIELGTRRIKARHFLKDAAAQTESQAGAAFVAGIKEGIERAISRG